jgi:Putative zinc-finger
MEHSEAVRLKAADRYLLGELSAELRDQFEEHYFGCAECAEELKLGAAFLDGAREVLAVGPPAAAPERLASQPASKRESGGWVRWLLRPAFAAPALAALLILVAYQNVRTIPRLSGSLSRAEAPQALPSFSLITANSRGAEGVTITADPTKPFGLFVDIPPERPFASYVCEFEDAAGAVEFRVPVSAEQARSTVQLLVPSSRLNTGKHVLVVLGSGRGLGSPEEGDASSMEVARFPFTVQFSH